MILLLLFLVLFTVAYIYHRKLKQLQKNMENIPGPPLLPFIGNALEFGRSNKEILNNFKRLTKQYGPVVRLYLGPQACILLSEPKYIAQVMSSITDKPDLYKMLEAVIGDGLASSSGEKWRKHRRIIEPMFSSRQLAEYMTIFNDNSKKLVQRLKPSANSEKVDVTEDVYDYTMRSIFNAAVNVDTEHDKEYQRALYNAGGLAITRMFSLFIRFDFIYKFTSDYKLFQAYKKTIQDYTDSIISKRKRDLDKKVEGTPRCLFLDNLLHLSGRDLLTHEEIRDEVKTMIIAGSDTIGSALSLGLFELAKHPDVQERILEETNQVLGNDKSTEVSFVDAQYLQYTDRVYKEILRMYPPAPFIIRKLQNEMKLDNTLVIPAGAYVIIFITGAHLSKKDFPNPEEFNPDRHLPENAANRNSHAFIPFGGGPRICIVMILLCLFVILSTLLLLLYQKQKQVLKKVENIPGPPVVPFLGNILEFGTNSTEILINLKRLAKKYGSVVRLCIGWKVFILLSEPKYMLQILKHIDGRYVHELLEKNLRPITDKGLSTLTGETWSKHRRILNRSFSAKHLEKYTKIFNKNSNILVSNLSKKVGLFSTDVTQEIFSCTLNIICNVVMQVDVTENVAYTEALNGVLDLATNRVFSLLKHFDIFYRLTSDFKLFQKYLKTLDEFYEDVLAKHKQNITSEENAASKGAIIDELLSLGVEDAFTHEEIRGETQTLIAAGSETIGTTLTFVLYELAKRPDVQAKILQETQRILGPNKNADVTFEHTHQLKYTECVIKETLRVYAPAQVFPKPLGEDAKIDHMTIPAGTDIFLYIGAIHVSPNYYKNPEEFLPDRFLSEDNKDNHAFIPFGIGPKMCIGHKFAVLEAKVIIAKLVRNFELLPAQPEHQMELKLGGVLKSANGVPLILKLRE